MIPRHLKIGVAVMLAVVLAMSFYAWRMRGQMQQAEPAAAYIRHVTPPVQGPTEQVTLYVAYDDPGSLRAQGASCGASRNPSIDRVERERHRRE